MATHDYVIDNSTGANVRADINNALAAIVSNNSSSSQPATRYAYMWWADTTNGVLKIRNSANDGWVELLQLDGTLTLEDGSASTPALAFRDDLDTGIYSSAANTFNVATGGVERMELGATTIFNEDGADVDFRIEGDSDANLFYLDASADRIGVGTNSPAAKVYISETGTLTSGDINANADGLVVDNNGGNTGLTFKTPNSASSRIAFGDPEDNNAGQILYSQASNFFAFDTGGLERMRLDSSGRLLMGTSTQFGDGTDKLMIEKGTDGGRIAFGTSAGFSEPIIGQVSAYWADSKKVAAISFFGGSDTGNKDDGTMRFATSSEDNLAERMRINSSGLVLIGSTSAISSETRLTVRNNTEAKVSHFHHNHNSQRSCIDCQNDHATSSNNAIMIEFRRDNGSSVGGIFSSTSATTYSTSSDYRLKENQVAISDGVTRLKQLKPYKFNFKENKDKIVDGFFAHEVSSVVPEAITGTKDEVDSDNSPVYQGIDQSKLVPLLVAAVQELIIKVETLEAA
tara:strand:+ start:3026 stop:4570 length:1545 start_codon:yes stop_codon:yes gene_type:complete